MDIKALLLTAALVGAAAPSAHAAVIGTQGFADLGTPSVVGGDINAATKFTIGALLTSTANSGILAGYSSFINFGSVSFDTTVGNSLSFGNASFGDFTSTSFTLSSSTAGSETIYALGDWTPGSYGGVPAGSYAASFTISFTQTPANTGSISDSATFSVPPAGSTAVPEISTWAMMLAGFSALGFAGYRRRAAA
jgi:hypothetical protein